MAIDYTTSSYVHVCVFFSCLNISEGRRIKFLRKFDSFSNDETRFQLEGDHGCAFHRAVEGALCMMLAATMSRTLGTIISVADACMVLLVSLQLSLCLQPA